VTGPTAPTALQHLARRARAAVADPVRATLLIAGVGRVEPDSPAVVMTDRAGTPTFVCDPQSPVSGVAGNQAPAVLTVQGAETEVAVVGRLVLSGTDSADGAGVVIVSLAPQRVLVDIDDPQRHAVTQVEVPLALYQESDDHILVDDLSSIVSHLNDAHQAELCQFAARQSATSVASIAGARLSHLDGHGARVHWVEADGARSATITFATGLTCPRAIALALRRHLDQS
jgi:hypothetical protein